MSSCVFLFGVLSTVLPGLAQKVAGGWFSFEKGKFLVKLVCCPDHSLEKLETLGKGYGTSIMMSCSSRKPPQSQEPNPEQKVQKRCISKMAYETL